MFAEHITSARDYAPPAESDVSSLTDRLEEVCRLRGWNESEWTEAAGVSRSTISAYRRRAREDVDAKMNPTTLRALAHAAKVTETWLRTGEGQREVTPLRAVATASGEVSITMKAGEAPEFVLGRLSNWSDLETEARKLRPLHPEWAWERTRKVPLFLRVDLTASLVAAIADLIRWGETSVYERPTADEVPETQH